MKIISLVTCCLLLSLGAQADDKTYKQFGDTRVYFSAFNSSFISPDIASIYNIVRGVDKGLVNISVIEGGTPKGKTALVTGTVSNIFAQQQNLDFFEVREGDAVYYLAPFEFENEDSLTFKIQVKLDPAKPAKSLVFQRTFYHD